MTTSDLRSSTSTPLVEDLDASGILASIRAARSTEDAAAARQLTLAAGWADLHPPESIDSAASFTLGGGLGREHEEPIAGPGCPLVAEFCVAELGTVLGITTTSAKKLIGHALELRHRLPRLWAQVRAGQVPAWRARIVAEATIHTSPALTLEAAGWVDAQVAAVAGKIGAAQLDRLLAETLKRYDLTLPDPTADPEDGWLHVDPRHATIDTDEVHFAGTLHLDAEIDIADGLDLDRALAHSAAVQKALGSELTLNARRAKALGDLARTQTALDLFTQGHTGQGHTGQGQTGQGQPGARSDAKDQDGLPVAREVVLHAHFDASTDGDATIFGPTGRLENGQRLILLDQLRGWCGDSRTKITIKPVIDLNSPLTASGYAVPDRIRAHVILRDHTCVFPWCTRPARRCDIDHITPYDHTADTADAEGRPQPGPTHTDNLAALCRFHHRLKTHTGWRYQMVEPGAFVWTSPHGHRFRRDRTGSTPMDPPEPPGPQGPGLETGAKAPSSTNDRQRRP